MNRKNNFRWKMATLFLVLALIVPVLAACDDDDDEETTTVTVTTTTKPPTTTTTKPPTATTTTQPTATTPVVSDESVKMGISMAITGPMAMGGMIGKQVLGMVEKMVEENGGIQVGGVKRPVEFIWYDDKGEVSGTQAGWTKLVEKDHISIMAMGGVSGAQCEEMAAQANRYKVPLINYSGRPPDLTDYPYTVRVAMKSDTSVLPTAEFILDLKPKTVAWLGEEEESSNYYYDLLKSQALDPIGAEVVYEQYVTVGTQDYSPYLTRIKYEDPDLLVQYGANFMSFGSVYQNIDGLGGWGDMTYIGAMQGANPWQELPSAVGTYQYMMWAPMQDNPGTKEYLQACERYGVEVDPNHINMWNALWTAIHAVEQAGSDDPETINQTLRSGEFQWEAPTGLLKMGTDGEPGIRGVLVKVGEGGQLTLVK